MRVRLRNPDREVEVAGERRVHDVLGELDIYPDTVLVIRERELLTREDLVRDEDEIEVRPVISGGARSVGGVLRGIDYVIEECPLVAGNTQLRYKEVMNRLEAASPGTKARFFLGYLDRAAPLFTEEDRTELRPCGSCGQPTTGRFCAFCRARAQILGTKLGDPQGAREVARELADEVLPAEIYGRASA